VDELIPLSFGLLLGSVLGTVRPSLRLSVGAAMVVALGFAATVVTGEAEVSWGYLLIDIPTVAVAAALGWAAARQLARFRGAR
jgi:hypothetical protein